jgi:riboflavin kinase/FMN adenylyltransferase
MLVACIGCFDGVHIGHQEIIRTTIRKAKEDKLSPKAISILNPWASFFPNFPGLIYPVHKRFQIIHSLGINEIEELDLSEIRDTPPQVFIESVLAGGVKSIVVGRDFTFGRHASGDVALLDQLAPELGYELVEVPEIVMDSRKVSSSWIRELLAQGAVEKASELLGRPYSIVGKVYKDKLLGRKLGFPTANITPRGVPLARLRPGVYIVNSVIDGVVHFGVLNAGFRPTVNPSTEIKYEVHFFDFSADLYHKYLEIELLHFIRPELKFDTLSELTRRIAEDVHVAKTWLKRNAVSSKTLT